VDRLGFEKTVEVPHDGRVGFVILNRGNVEIMYQSRASVAADLPILADFATPGSTVLYIGVSNIEEIETSMADLEPAIPMRQTTYGAAEIGFREPAGNVVIFNMQAGY